MGQSVRQDDLFAVFKVKVTLRAHIITYGGFYHIYGTPDLFATKFDVDGISSQAGVFSGKNWTFVFKVKATEKVQNFMESCCILYPLYH